MKDSQFLNEALLYAKKGWRLFPIVPAEKTPLIRGWQNQATNNAAIITAWWKKHPNANIGVLTGTKNKLIVIDVDPRNGGLESLESLKQKFPNHFEEPTVSTGNGGFHFYFKYSNAMGRCLNGRLSGIDVKSNGGYVVAPPSKLKNGGEYKWL